MDATIALRVDESLKTNLAKLAKLDKRRLTDYIRLVLEKHIAESALQDDEDWPLPPPAAPRKAKRVAS